MPKVLRIINRFNLGGPTYNAAYLTKHLGEEYRTVLIGGDKEENEDSSDFILKQIGVKPILIPEMRRSISYNSDIRAYYKIKHIIDRFKPDIVHTHASKAGSLGRMAARNAGVPVIVHTFHGHVFHSYFGKTKTTIYKQIERRLAKASTRIIALSEKQKFELSQEHRICSPEKISVIPLGFDLQRFQENKEEKRKAFRAKYHVADDEVAIGIVGRLVPVKNHDFFLMAIKKVLDHKPGKVKAFIVGDGERKEDLLMLAGQLDIPFAVGPENAAGKPLVFTSWEKQVDMVNAGLDIVCLTSLNEGTPVSLIEAQASGKPVVSTQVGGIENVVLADQTALLSPKDDLDLFSRNLLQLIVSPEQRELMGQQGWDWVSDRFHYTRLVRDMRNLYEELLMKQSPSLHHKVL